MLTATKKYAPSWMFDLPEEKRRALLAKRGRDGRPVWTIATLPREEVLRRPFTPIGEVALAKVALLAMLNGEAPSTACELCGLPMSAEYGVTQSHETCPDDARKAVAS